MQHRISGGNTYGCDTHTNAAINKYGIDFQFSDGQSVTAVAAGTVKLVGTSRDEIVRQCERLLTDPDAYLAMSRAHNPYGDGQAAARIVPLPFYKRPK